MRYFVVQYCHVTTSPHKFLLWKYIWQILFLGFTYGYIYHQKDNDIDTSMFIFLLKVCTESKFIYILPSPFWFLALPNGGSVDKLNPLSFFPSLSSPLRKSLSQPIPLKHVTPFILSCRYRLFNFEQKLGAPHVAANPQTSNVKEST